MTKYFIVLLVMLGVFLQSNMSWAVELPRYASLRDDKTNMRTGPGARYPIRWVLTRKLMPVKIIREFETWRQVEMFDNDTSGWVHKNLLSSKKTAIIVNDAQKLHKKPEDDSAVMLQLEPGVIVELDHCANAWCSVEISGYEGWLANTGIWGDIDNDE